MAFNLRSSSWMLKSCVFFEILMEHKFGLTTWDATLDLCYLAFTSVWRCFFSCRTVSLFIFSTADFIMVLLFLSHRSNVALFITLHPWQLRNLKQKNSLRDKISSSSFKEVTKYIELTIIMHDHKNIFYIKIQIIKITSSLELCKPQCLIYFKFSTACLLLRHCVKHC